MDNLSLLYDLGHTKIANLDSFLAIKENIVQLNISMNDRSAVNVCQSISDLLKDEFGIALLKLSFSFDQSEEVATTGIFHDHEQVLAALEDLEESDHVGVLYLFEQIHLLEDLSLAKVVLHVILLDRLDGNLFTCQLVNTKRYFTEGTLSNKFDKFVEI